MTTTTPDASIDGTPVGYPMPWLPWRNCQDDRTFSPRRRGNASPHVEAEVAHVHSVDSTESAVSVRRGREQPDRKSTRLNSSHVAISYAVFCLTTKTRPRS